MCIRDRVIRDFQGQASKAKCLRPRPRTCLPRPSSRSRTWWPRLRPWHSVLEDPRGQGHVLEDTSLNSIHLFDHNSVMTNQTKTELHSFIYYEIVQMVGKQTRNAWRSPVISALRSLLSYYQCLPTWGQINTMAATALISILHYAYNNMHIQ